MYGREYDGKTLRFEASGGLWHYALVMADKETDSYWSIMTGDALAGPLAGTPLEELPMGSKARWKDWVAAHPETLVLSVDGEEHDDSNPYENYFTSERTPQGAEGKDDRLPPKAPVYTFQRSGQAYAIPYSAFEGGAVLLLEQGGEASGGKSEETGEEIFLYRPEGEAIFYSTLGWIGPFETDEEGRVRHVPTGAVFDPESEGFTGGDGGAGSVPRLEGFDTFWFHWSQVHPDTRVLGD